MGIVITDKFVYHVSLPANRQSILEKGLMPQRGDNCLHDTKIDFKAIFATNSPDKKHWFDNDFDNDVFEIDTSLLPDVIWFEDENFSWLLNNYHIYSKVAIPTHAIKLVYEGTGKDFLLI